MRIKHWFGAASVAAVALTATVAGGGAIGASGDSDGDTTVRIGVPLDMSGAAAIADIGESELHGIETALAQIEAEGFLEGFEIELVTIDTKADKQDAVAALLRLVDQEKVDAILGFTLTPSFMAAVPPAIEAGIPVIALGLAAPGVTDVGENVFRIIPNVTGLYAANDHLFLDQIGAQTVAYLYVNDSETTVAIHNSRVAALDELGFEKVAEQAFTTSDTDYRAQLTAIDGANPDAIVLTTFPGQIGPIFLQAEELGITTPILSSDGSAREDVLAQAGEAMQCTVFNSVWAAQNETGRNPQFVEALGSGADLYAAAGYDAMWVYAEALKAAGTADAESLIAALNDLEDFHGAFGVYSFDENRNPGIYGVNLQIQDGVAVLWSPDHTCA